MSSYDFHNAIPGPRNAITDIEGLRVGNAHCSILRSGVTVVVTDKPVTCGFRVLGGAPGTRETDLLAVDKTVEHIDAIVLSGGSAYGLDAASGVHAALAAMGRGVQIGTARVPIVPAAILFDLLNGGDKSWGDTPPYRVLGIKAFEDAINGKDSEFGSVGAGFGATTAIVKGGLGTASIRFANGLIIGALVAVNALGNPMIGDGPYFRAAPFEIDNEFGGLGLPKPWPLSANNLYIKTHGSSSLHANTTIAVIATNARLTKAQATQLATASHDGYAQALWPAHTPLDGDCIFSLATGDIELTSPLEELIILCAASSTCMARAIARGIYMASAIKDDIQPSWQSLFG